MGRITDEQLEGLEATAREAVAASDDDTDDTGTRLTAAFDAYRRVLTNLPTSVELISELATELVELRRIVDVLVRQTEAGERCVDSEPRDEEACRLAERLVVELDELLTAYRAAKAKRERMS